MMVGLLIILLDCVSYQLGFLSKSNFVLYGMSVKYGKNKKGFQSGR